MNEKSCSKRREHRCVRISSLADVRERERERKSARDGESFYLTSEIAECISIMNLSILFPLCLQVYVHLSIMEETSAVKDLITSRLNENARLEGTPVV